MRLILVVADDLTGALEAGAAFAGQGIPSRVTSDCGLDAPNTPVLVIDSETRHLTASRAALVVRDIADRMRPHDPWLVYKKTDSTLRGNIVAELQALHEAFPKRDLVYVPAHPAMGRTVRQGHLLVHGVPVHQTEFAADPLNPVHDSRVPSQFGPVQATVFDGECEEDVRAAARNIASSNKPLLVAGPAAIGAALAEYLDLNRDPIRPFPRLDRCLIVNGSMHPASKRQIAAARESGSLKGGWQLFEPTVERTGMRRAKAIGEAVRSFLSGNSLDGIVVFGGDTAFGIHQALGSHAFEPYGEVLPGMPLSRSGGLYWITKAGGFGDPHVLCELRKRLT